MIPKVLHHVTKFINSNEKITGIMNTVKSLEEFGLLLKGISETIKNEAKGLKGWFLGMLLGTLGTSSLRIPLTGKGVKTKLLGRRVMTAGEGTIRAVESTIGSGQNF